MAAICIAPADALARVGVTSASDGSPLGKPPNENERILRIGIDVQANELVTTGANDRAHLVFLDGSSLTVGPNARVTIDRFVFDPGTQTGDLAISASRGVFRLVGGKLSKKQPIVITTPSSSIGIRGGITILSVTSTQTVADFIFGTSMTVTGGGRTQTATRAGSQIIANAGGIPGAPTLMKQGALKAPLAQLEGTAPSDNKSPDRSAEQSGFSSQNSGQPATAGPSGPPNLANNTLTSALSNANIETQQAVRPTTTAALTVTVTTTPRNNPVAGPASNPTPPATPPAPPTPPPGTPRTSQTLTGFAAGMVYGRPGNQLTAQLIPGEVSITTDAATGQAKSTIVVHDLRGSTHRPWTTTLQLGGTGGLGADNSAFIDDKTYVMVTQYNDWSRLSQWQKGGRSVQATDTSVLATATTAPIPFQIPSQGTLAACACEFLSWGWWGSSVPDPRDLSRTYTAVGPYVAGVPTTSVQLPQTGSATYSGFMAGMVNNSGTVYAGAGSYQNIWNFGARSGAFSGAFDGRTYSGTTQAIAGSNGTAFTGSFTGGGGPGSLKGGFFASPTDAAKYQAGTFAIGSDQSSYKASGVFAGQR